MDANERELILKDEVYQIVGAAMEVFNQLGCGFLEAVYQEAFEIELDERRISHVPQKRIEISYKGRVLNKDYIADFLCNDQIVVELKAIKAISGDRRRANPQLLRGNESSAWVDRQFRRASTRMEALCQYEEEPLMEAQMNANKKNLLVSIRVHSRLFAREVTNGAAQDGNSAALHCRR